MLINCQNIFSPLSCLSMAIAPTYFKLCWSHLGVCCQSDQQTSSMRWGVRDYNSFRWLKRPMELAEVNIMKEDLWHSANMVLGRELRFSMRMVHREECALKKWTLVPGLNCLKTNKNKKKNHNLQMIIFSNVEYIKVNTLG